MNSYQKIFVLRKMSAPVIPVIPAPSANSVAPSANSVAPTAPAPGIFAGITSMFSSKPAEKCVCPACGAEHDKKVPTPGPQTGAGRRAASRNNRGASRKNNRKNRKNNRRSSRKNNRKDRKASRKNSRKASC